jgi:endonuclease-3
MTPRELYELTELEIEELIYPVGFYHRKAANLRVVSAEILEKYQGQVPDDIEELVKLPGVGRKTANLVVTEGYNKPGICVDTHVHRICNRLGYIKTKTPDQTEIKLRNKLPKKRWIPINAILVTFGQNICRPVSPHCSKCPIQKKCPKLDVKYQR